MAYDSIVARPRKPEKGPRPEQGARLLSLREAAGLTQVELARAVGTSHASIANWEWSDKPPRSEFITKLAETLRVTTDQLLNVTDLGTPKRNRRGPAGEVDKVFDEVRRLPRSQQRKVLETVMALVHEYERRAG